MDSHTEQVVFMKLCVSVWMFS